MKYVLPLAVIWKPEIPHASWLMQKLYLQTIDFDDFEIFEGRCSPMDEPLQRELTLPIPMWPSMITNLDEPTALLANIKFEKAFVGGGCGNVEVQNTVDVPCDEFQIELNIRPEWGGLLESRGQPRLNSVTLMDSNAEAGTHVFVLYSSQCTYLIKSIQDATNSNTSVQAGFF